jgi:uncharacterized protein (DUF1778 family)
LRAAAAIFRQPVSVFVRESALARADEVLSGRRVFCLDTARWDAFIAALDKPPRPLPHLKRLLDEPGFLDEPV